MRGLSWLRHSPRELGHKEFFRRYLSTAEEKFEKYFPGQWSFTKRLEAIGQRVASRQIADDASLMLFLIDVAVWKEPYESQAKDMIGLVIDNSYAEIRSAFYHVWHALSRHLDKEAVDAIGSLRGFGKGGSRKVASAVLRFLDPSRFAVVDYRNWAVLSNTEGQYFEKPLLEPLALTIEETRASPIDTRRYLEYLTVVRQLAAQNGISPAEVDMALFAFSDEIRSLYIGTSVYEGRDTAGGAEDVHETLKRQRMVEVVMRVVNDNKRARQAWLRNSAVKLEVGLKKCRTPYEIMEMCLNMLRGTPTMDLKIRALGRLSLADVKDELDRIYYDTK